MLRNILGPEFWTQPWADFELNLFDIFGPYFPFSKNAETPIFIVFSAKIPFCKPTPKKLGTLFVNTTALTDFLFVRFFCIFVFFGVCCVRFFGGLFLRGMKKQKKTKFKTKQQKGKKTTRCKQQNHLVLFIKRENQTTQSQNNTNQMSKMETNNTRKNKQEPKPETEKI